MSRRVLVLAEALLAAVAFTACGSTPDATISGKVQDTAGQALPDAVVVVGDGAVRPATMTTPTGAYSLSKQLTGSTPVHIFAPGFIYDPGHNLKSLQSGDNTYNTRLKPQPPGSGPRFDGDPTVTVSGSTVHLQAQIVAGPRAAVGSELLAVDTADGHAVLLTRDASGAATGSIPRPQVRPNVQWLFIATDNACQESSRFPTAQQPS